MHLVLLRQFMAVGELHPTRGHPYPSPFRLRLAQGYPPWDTSVFRGLSLIPVASMPGAEYASALMHSGCMLACLYRLSSPYPIVKRVEPHAPLSASFGA